MMTEDEYQEWLEQVRKLMTPPGMHPLHAVEDAEATIEKRQHLREGGKLQ